MSRESNDGVFRDETLTPRTSIVGGSSEPTQLTPPVDTTDVHRVDGVVVASLTSLRRCVAAYFRTSPRPPPSSFKGQSSVLTISEYFPGLYTTTPDFKTKWEPVVPVLKALLANGTIFGFNLGDELVWSGMPPTNLVRYADAVRASFPRGDAVIWYVRVRGNQEPPFP